MNILVAGSSGVIGSGLTSDLIQDGNIYGLNKISKPNEVDAIFDLTKKDNFKNFPFKNIYFDAIIFLVGLAHSKGSKATEKLHYETNCLSLSNLLNFMNSTSRLPKKIIFASTISVYGENINKTEFIESDKLKPEVLCSFEDEDYLNHNFPDDLGS